MVRQYKALTYTVFCVLQIILNYLADDFPQILDLLKEFKKGPGRMGESIASQASTGTSARPTRTKELSLKSMEALQLPTDSDR